jgi:secreted PhoX family phosphatase
MLTNNAKRTAAQIDAANPRAANKHGHVIELSPPCVAVGDDHAADEFRWEMFLRGGDPRVAAHAASCHGDVTADGWLSCPDNAFIDAGGRLWIATDGSAAVTERTDAVFACDTVGPGRALTRRFFAVPRGAESSGVFLTPDRRTMFVSVQHPGEEKGSTFSKPSTRWPDFSPTTPPRPSVVAITRRDGGEIGS